MPVRKARPLQPIVRARRRRSILPAYFDLGGKGIFFLVILGASLLALLALAQTGQAVSVGCELRRLQREQKALSWEREALLGQYAAQVHPARLADWAQEQDWHWLQPQEITFIPVAVPPSAASTAGAAVAEQP